MTAAVSPVRGLWQAKRADAAMSAKGGKSGSGYVRPKHMELGDHIDQPMSELLAPWAVRSLEEVSRPRLLHILSLEARALPSLAGFGRSASLGLRCHEGTLVT